MSSERLLGNTMHVMTSCCCDNVPRHRTFTLKGLGHAILGNFSTDQMVIELTKI